MTKTVTYIFKSNNPDADLIIPMCGLYGSARAEAELAKRQDERLLAPAFQWLEAVTHE